MCVLQDPLLRTKLPLSKSATPSWSPGGKSTLCPTWASGSDHRLVVCCLWLFNLLLCNLVLLRHPNVWCCSSSQRCFLPQAYADYLGFVLTLNDGVKGRKITSEYKVSEVCCAALRCVVLCASPAFVFFLSCRAAAHPSLASSPPVLTDCGEASGSSGDS